MKEIVPRIIHSLILLFLATQIYGQTKSNFPTLEYADIQKLNISLPYIKYYGVDSSLLVFGSNHTSNFNDSQINQICNLIYLFKPTVILYEGDGISTEKTLRETVETYFEMGLAKYLGDSLEIYTANIEPPTKEKYKFLMRNYSINDILIATLGLQITMMQINNNNFDTLFPTLINDLIKEGLPLSAEQQTIDYFYKLYKNKFGKTFSYQNFDSRNIQAKYNKTIFNTINQAANKFRDQSIINLAKHYIDRKEKVFLLEGGWHAIVCEPAYKLITK